MRKVTLALLMMVVVLFMSGCGGSQSSMTPTTPTNPAPDTATVGLTVGDQPPSGVTVLFFQLSITGATLTNSTGGTVSLLSSANPIPINVSQLQTNSAFLGSQNVAAGTYNSLSVTFASPQLTIFNASDSSISSTCAVGTVCQITPSTTSGSSLALTFSSSPFPVTLTASSSLAFRLDIHLDTVIQSDLSLDLSATNGVTVSQVSSSSSGAPIPRLGKLQGTVQSVGTNQFTLQSWFGRTFTIDVNSSTTYNNFPSSATCSSDFACLATEQVVNVTVTLQSGGTLLASEVDYVQPSTQQSVQGNIVGLSTSNGNTIMDLIIQWNASNSSSTSLPMGHHVQVTVPNSGVTYAINWNGFSFTAPSGVTLSFASASDLQVGQQVQAVVEGTVSTTTGSGSSSGFGPVGRGAASFSTNSITLEPSQITGTVASQPNTSSMSFTLATMPAFFVPPSTTAGGAPNWAPDIITVLTNTSTTLTNVTSLSGLATDNVVSVDGWAFSTPSGATPTTVVADQVVLQQGPTPPF